MIKSLADELKQLRDVRGRDKKISLRAVERATGISNEYLSQLERGIASRPAPEVLQKLAQYYDIPYETLLVAAGYLREKSRESTRRVIPREVEALAKSAGFSSEEWAEVREYMSFVASKRRPR